MFVEYNQHLLYPLVCYTKILDDSTTVHWPFPYYCFLTVLLIFIGTKQNICFGCVGFLIGSLIGISIGMALRKYQPVVHYMQAVQCTTYSGIEVLDILKSYCTTFCSELF